MTDSKAYLDHAASTPLNSAALRFLSEVLPAHWANPSASHALGRSLHKEIDQARKSFLSWAGAIHSFDMVFTGSATESNNMVIKSFSGAPIAFFLGDHPSLVEPAQWSAKHDGGKEIPILVDQYGWIDREAILSSIDENTQLVVISHVNNHSGVVTDIHGLSMEIKQAAPKVHLHVDGVQAFGKLRVELDQSMVDSYTVSAHKMGGPKGVAGLFLRKGHSVQPLLLGGSQENGLRASTLNHPLILAWEKAAESEFSLKADHYKHVSQLNHLLRKQLTEAIATLEWLFIPVEGQSLSPYILTFAVPGIPSDILLRHLEGLGIFVSSSSACSSKIKGFNPTFKALGIVENRHKNVLRVSLSGDSSESEIQYFCESLKGTYQELSKFVGLSQ